MGSTIDLRGSSDPISSRLKPTTPSQTEPLRDHPRPNPAESGRVQITYEVNQTVPHERSSVVDAAATSLRSMSSFNLSRSSTKASLFSSSSVTDLRSLNSKGCMSPYQPVMSPVIVEPEKIPAESGTPQRQFSVTSRFSQQLADFKSFSGRSMSVMSSISRRRPSRHESIPEVIEQHPPPVPPKDRTQSGTQQALLHRWKSALSRQEKHLKVDGLKTIQERPQPAVVSLQQKKEEEDLRKMLVDLQSLLMAARTMEGALKLHRSRYKDFRAGQDKRKRGVESAKNQLDTRISKIERQKANLECAIDQTQPVDSAFEVLRKNVADLEAERQERVAKRDELAQDLKGIIGSLEINEQSWKKDQRRLVARLEKPLRSAWEIGKKVEKIEKQGGRLPVKGLSGKQLCGQIEKAAERLGVRTSKWTPLSDDQVYEAMDTAIDEEEDFKE